MTEGNLSNLGFDARTVEPNTFDVLPAGWYEVAITSSEMRNTLSGSGRYLALDLQVLQGQWHGRKLFDRLNLENTNQKAVEISRGTLSSICRAVGVLTPGDSSELHDKPLLAKVVIKMDQQYGARNEIQAYKPLSDSQAAQHEVAAALNAPRVPGPPQDDSIPF